MQVKVGNDDKNIMSKTEKVFSPNKIPSSPKTLQQLRISRYSSPKHCAFLQPPPCSTPRHPAVHGAIHDIVPGGVVGDGAASNEVELDGAARGVLPDKIVHDNVVPNNVVPDGPMYSPDDSTRIPTSLQYCSGSGHELSQQWRWGVRPC